MGLEQIVRLARLANDCDRLARECRRAVQVIVAQWGADNGYFGLSPEGAIRMHEQTSLLMKVVTGKEGADND